MWLLVDANRRGLTMSPPNLYTAEMACSIKECCRAWSATSYSQDDADRSLDSLVTAAGVENRSLGMRDGHGNPIVCTFCGDCWAGIVGVVEADSRRGGP